MQSAQRQMRGDLLEVVAKRAGFIRYINRVPVAMCPACGRHEAQDCGYGERTFCDHGYDFDCAHPDAENRECPCSETICAECAKQEENFNGKAGYYNHV